MQKKVIIIGGGLAGLSAACLAVQHGYRVDLYDENSSLGGDSRSTTVQGFQFDRHPKFFPAPYLLDSLIKSTSSSDLISSQFQSISPATQLLFADGKRMQFATEQDAQNSAQDSHSILTLKAESAFQKLDGVLQEIIEHSSGRQKNLWQKISPTRSMNLQQPLAPFLQQLSTDPYLQQSLLTLSALTGTSIPDLQVRDLFLPALIRKSGLFFPKQGWDVIINRIQNYLLGAGVKFFLQTKVLEIFPPQKNVIGVRLADQSQQWADEILNTTDSLAPKEMQFSPTQPMMIFHLGLKKISGLATFSYYNIMMINGNLKSWNTNKNLSPAWLPDYLYVYHPTVENPQLAPEGRSLISIKIPLPSTPIQMREKEMLRLKILNLLERTYLPGLKQNIEMESTETLDSATSQNKVNLNTPTPLFTPPTSRVIHLPQYYDNRRPSIPAMLFAVQRWIESTRP